MSDTGIGIPEELRERIFEKFYKIDPFKKGLGLGLSVARHIAEQMGGTLAFDRLYEGLERVSCCRCPINKVRCILS